MNFNRNKKPKEEQEDDGKKGEHKYDLFPELLNNFTKTRKIYDDANPAMAFIMARFLSMCSIGFDVAATYNDLALKLPDWARRPLIFHLTPKMKKAPYMKYVGKPKEKISAKAEAIIDRMQKHFNVRRHHAEEMYHILKLQKKKPGRAFGLEDEKQ